MLSFQCNLFRYSVFSHCQYIYNWHIWPWIIVVEISDIVLRVRLRNNITMFSLNLGKFVQIGDCFNNAGSWNKKERLLNIIEVNPLNPELNPICYLLALLGAHHFLHVSRIRVKSLTIRLLISYIYIYGVPVLDVSRSHTTTQHSR